MRRNIEQQRLEMNFTSASCHSPQKRDQTQGTTARQDKLEYGWTHRIQRHFPFSKLIFRKPFASTKVVVHSTRMYKSGGWGITRAHSSWLSGRSGFIVRRGVGICVFRSQVFKLNKKPLRRRGGGI